MGATLPLFSQYLQSIGLTGTEIGTIFSVGTFISILFQPFWGFMADRTNAIKKILIFLLIFSALTISSIPFTKSFMIIAILYASYQFFTCGIFPLNDAATLHSKYEFGRIRQWGSVGFATAAFISSILAQYLSNNIIFYITAFACIIALIFLNKIDAKSSHNETINLALLKDLLKNKNYILFLIMAFFIGGTINANNTYFGLLYKHLGGTTSGIGFAFLLFALSEAPFLKNSDYIIKKFGVNKLLIFSGISFMLRWGIYSFIPSTKLILILFLLQGLSIGTFLAGAAQYINLHTKKSQTATAITIYFSLSLGIGSMLCIFLSGIIIDKINIFAAYKFYLLWSAIGFSVLMYLYYSLKKQNHR
jgi:PPP family 3-phenylpropionic acid transporter